MKNYSLELAKVYKTANDTVRKLKGAAFNALLNDFYADKELRAKAGKNFAPILRSRGIQLPKGVTGVFIDNNWSISITVRHSRGKWTVTIKFSS